MKALSGVSALSAPPDDSGQPRPSNATAPITAPISPWREFLLAFITIFLAELGDKTQLATLLMAAESQAPWVVFVGAALALILTSLIGVFLGRWLSQRLSAKTLQTATGASLLVIAVLLLWDVVHI